jgi:hypothetical protein
MIGHMRQAARAASRRGASQRDDAHRSIMSTPPSTRVPLNDAENLAVGAFGGIVETCVQSA